MLSIPTDFRVDVSRHGGDEEPDDPPRHGDPIDDAVAIVGIVAGSLRLAERRLERALRLLPSPSWSEEPPGTEEVRNPSSGLSPAQALRLRVEGAGPRLSRLVEELTEATGWLETPPDARSGNAEG